MTETFTAATAAGRRSLDLWLNAAIAGLLVGVIALGAWFAYTVYVTEQRKGLTNAPNRLIAALEDQVRANPNDAVLRVRLGEALGAARRFPEAVEQFNAALKIEPEHIGAHLDLGMVSVLTGNDAEAERYFKRVIELTDSSQYSNVDERRENALYNLGRLKLRQQEYEAAAGYLKAALRIRKDASDTYLSLARALQGLGDYDGAIKQAEYAIAFDPAFAEAHYTMGQLYEAKGDKVNASYHYYQAAKLEPDAEPPQEALAGFGPPSDWIARARAALAAKNTDEALEAALVARNLDPANIEAVLVHAAVLERRSDFRNALEVYLAGRKLEHGNKAVDAGIAAIERAHPKEALAVYRKLLKESPGDADLKNRVARLSKSAR